MTNVFTQFSGLQGNVVLGAPQLHPSRLGGEKLPCRVGEHRQGGRLRARAIRVGRSVHQFWRNQIPDQMGAARGSQLHTILVQERRLGLRWEIFKFFSKVSLTKFNFQEF